MIRILYTDISGAEASDYSRLYEKASPERKLRAEQCHRLEDKLRCVAAEALLRCALGTDSFRLEKGPFRKPYLPEYPDFYFNLSHGGKWVVIAYGNREVGVDVEPLRTDRKVEALTRRYFAEEEQSYVFGEEESQQQRFMEIWTGKESYLKYLGTGLQKTLNSFSILSLEPELRFHRRTMPDGSQLCLCTADPQTQISFIEWKKLIETG